MSKLRIALAGGGSGGHIYPLLAVAEALRETAPGAEMEIRYYGPEAGYGPSFAQQGISIRRIAGSKLRRYASGWLANLLDVPRFFWSLLQAGWKLYWYMPDAIFSKGGPGALPVVLWSWFYRIPVVIHESDAIPGVTNLLSAKFSQRVMLSFAAAAKYFPPRKARVTGQPLRKELTAALPVSVSAKRELDFDPAKPLLLIVCGSQGSRRISEFVVLNLPDLLEETQILHQTGTANFLEMEKLAKTQLAGLPVQIAAGTRYKAVPFIENMALALGAADAVIARAGSGIFEIAAAGKPAIIVPLQESANDHQRANAMAYAESGAAIVIEESNLLPGIVLRELKTILEQPAKAAGLAQRAKEFYQPGAAAAIAQEILDLSGFRPV